MKLKYVNKNIKIIQSDRGGFMYTKEYFIKIIKIIKIIGMEN